MQLSRTRDELMQTDEDKLKWKCRASSNCKGESEVKQRKRKGKSKKRRLTYTDWELTNRDKIGCIPDIFTSITDILLSLIDLQKTIFLHSSVWLQGIIWNDITGYNILQHNTSLGRTDLSNYYTTQFNQLYSILVFPLWNFDVTRTSICLIDMYALFSLLQR